MLQNFLIIIEGKIDVFELNGKTSVHFFKSNFTHIFLRQTCDFIKLCQRCDHIIITFQTDDQLFNCHHNTQYNDFRGNKSADIQLLIHQKISSDDQHYQSNNHFESNNSLVLNDQNLKVRSPVIQIINHTFIRSSQVNFCFRIEFECFYRCRNILEPRCDDVLFVAFVNAGFDTAFHCKSKN